MKEYPILLLAAGLFFGGCATHLPEMAVRDSVGNLRGDQSRSFLDIVQADVRLQHDTYTLSVVVAASFPDAAEMVDKRLDIIWLVDIDRNTETGQSELGNDYNIHLYLSEDGWRSSWYKVTPTSQADGVAVAQQDFSINVKGTKADLSFPRSYLPSDSFDWWAYSGTLNAPNWPPMTENPHTLRSTFTAATPLPQSGAGVQ